VNIYRGERKFYENTPGKSLKIRGEIHMENMGKPLNKRVYVWKL